MIQDNVLFLMGADGRLEVDDFWYGFGKDGGTAKMRIVGRDGSAEVLEFAEHRNVYSFSVRSREPSHRLRPDPVRSPRHDASGHVGQFAVTRPLAEGKC